MRNIELQWTIEGLENGYLVQSLEIQNKKFFKDLEEAKEHLKKQIDEDCEAEFNDDALHENDEVKE